MILFVAYPGCSTCSRARKWLCDRGVPFIERHIRDERPTLEELRDWWERSGLPLRRFFNSSGVRYRALHLSERLAQMSAQEQLALLASDGMLLRRPIAVGEKAVLVGFHPEDWERLSD